MAFQLTASQISLKRQCEKALDAALLGLTLDKGKLDGHNFTGAMESLAVFVEEYAETTRRALVIQRRNARRARGGNNDDKMRLAHPDFWPSDFWPIDDLTAAQIASVW